MSTEVGRVAVRPGPGDEGPTGLPMPRGGDRPLPGALPAGVCRGDAPQAGHEWSGMVDARQVPARRHGGDGHGAGDPAPGVECRDTRGHTPRCDLRWECLYATREALRGF